MNPLSYRHAYQRHLPHFQPPGAMIFVTFRLVGSIPVQVQDQLRAEAERGDRESAHISDPEERNRRSRLEQRRLFERWDTVLDAAHSGPFWLRDPRIASLVAESLHYRDSRVYDPEAFSIMPNHVHAVFTPLPKRNGTYHALAAIMHSLKRHTARQANLLLERGGGFWQQESYDHVVRDEAERERIVAYVVNNPVRAELVDHWEAWEWTYCSHL